MLNQPTGVAPRISKLEVEGATSNSLHFKWTLTNGFSDRFELTYYYMVHGCLERRGPFNVTISNGSMMSYNLSDLIEDSNYTITVKAINIAGSTMDTAIADTLTSSEFCNSKPNLSESTFPRVNYQTLSSLKKEQGGRA